MDVEGQLRLVSVTVGRNPGQGIRVRPTGVLRLVSSVVSENMDACVVDAGGTVADGGGNVVSDTSCGLQPGSQQGVAAQLGDLSSDLGRTPVLKLPASSPARGAGNAVVCRQPLSDGGAGGRDQRRLLRPDQGTCDAGAVESGGFLTPLDPQDFGAVMVGSSDTRIVPITNVGDEPVLISSVALDGSGDMTVDGACDGATVPAFSSCTVTLTYAPLLPGTDQAVLTVSSDQQGGFARTASVVGEGAAVASPPASPSPSPSEVVPPDPGPVTPSPDPVSPSPDPVSPSPDPVSPSPDPVSPSPDPVSPSPDPVSPSPDPVSPSPAPVSPSPDPVPPSPDPVPPSPQPAPPTAEPSVDPQPEPPAPVPPAPVPPRPEPGPPSPAPSPPAPPSPPAASPSTSPAPAPVVPPRPSASPRPAGPSPSPSPSAGPLDPTNLAEQRELDDRRGSIPQQLTPPGDISFDPALLLRNGLLALLLLALIGIPLAVLNATIESHRTDIAAMLAPVRRPFARLPRPTVRPSQPLMYASLAVLAALVYSQLSPGMRLDSGGAVQFTGLLLTIVVTSVLTKVAMVSFLFTRLRTWATLRLFPGFVLLAVGCVVLTRTLELSPGLILGSLGGLAVARTLTDVERGRRTAFAYLTTLFLSLYAYLAWGPVAEAAAQAGSGFEVRVLDTVLASVALGGVEGIALGLMPIAFLDGPTLRAHRPVLWGGLWFGSVFLFLHLAVNPTDGPDGWVGREGYLATMLAVYVLLATAVWSFFRYRDRRRGSTARLLTPEPSTAEVDAEYV